MKKYKAIFFDLDGTLLAMELEPYIKEYFETIKEKMKKENFDYEKGIKAITNGLYKMMNNQGDKTNEEVFRDSVKEMYPDDLNKLEKILQDYYQNEYNLLKKEKIYPKIPSMLNSLKEKGYILVCATNPLYPKEATNARLKWAGISEKYFDYVTTYENSKYSKPNIKYFEELLEKLKLSASEVLMVGNDSYEDMIFKTISGETYLITDYLISKENGIKPSYCGSMDDFCDFALNVL